MSKTDQRPLLKIFLIILAGLFFMVLAGYVYIAYLLPVPETLLLNPRHLSTKIFDRQGTLLYEILSPAAGRKTYAKLSDLPPLFIKATVVSEDQEFYQHSGVDLGAMGRALFFNSINQKITSGASTITQQLVRNLLGTNRDRNLSEKLLEAVYSIRLSHLYSKDQVLEQYLNTVYFGNLAYGVAEASQNYFGKDLANLDLAEISILAGLPQSPANYNPLVNLPKAKKRQQYVLNRLVEAGEIAQSEADQAAQETLHFASGKTSIEAPHFVHHILAELEDRYGQDFVYSGISVTTTLDLNLQKKAQQIVDFQLDKIKDKHVTNAAVLAAEPDTGQIRVWLGSKDYFDDRIAGQVDLITSLRQPGSALKPFLYLLALQKGYTLASILEDLPLKIKTPNGVYAPLNYDLDFHGPVRVKEALANSFNIPAVRLQEKLGTANFLNFLRRLGLDSLDQPAEYYGDSLTLGGGEIRLVDLANAYLTLANYGQKKPFSDLLLITGSSGKTIYRWAPPAGQNILGPAARQLSYLIISAISDPQARLKSFGQGNVLELSIPAAAKTGTTRNFKDNWTFGFSTNLLTAVWVGNADATPMQNISGIDGAGPIWHDFMEYFHKYQHANLSKSSVFRIPQGLKQISICVISGLLPGENCRANLEEWFLVGTEPQTVDNFWQKFTCPDGPRYFIVYPYPYHSWANEHGYKPNPSCQQISFSTTTNEQPDNPLELISPLAGDAFQINSNIPLESQKIPISLVLHPFTPADAPAVISHLQLMINDQVIETRYLSDFTAPLEIHSKWLPKVGAHTLKITVYSSDSQIITSESLNFLVS